VVHLHSTHSVALSMLPEIDPARRAAADDAYYLMKCGATALVPYYRPGDPAVADAIKGWPEIFIRAARQSRSRGLGRYAGSRRVLPSRNWKRRQKLYAAAARAETRGTLRRRRWRI
jgi:hypothetical protein